MDAAARAAVKCTLTLSLSAPLSLLHSFSLPLSLWIIDPITQRAVDFYNRTIKFTIVDRYYRKIVINCRRPGQAMGLFFVFWRTSKVFSFVCDLFKSIIYILKSILLIAWYFSGILYLLPVSWYFVSTWFTIARWQRSDRPHKMRDYHRTYNYLTVTGGKAKVSLIYCD